MLKIMVALLLGLTIGAACRWYDLPLPSPPKLVGALLVLSMTLGYIATDTLIGAKSDTKGPATTEQLSGGPTGTPHSRPGS